MKWTIIICSVCLLTACASKLSKQEKNEGGVLSVFHIDDNGMKQGKKKVTHPEGYTMELAEYVDDKLEGQRTIFYDTGKPELIEYYVNDELQGAYKAYYPSGQLKYEVQYEAHVMDGLFTQYYDDGTKKEEVHFKDNEENGPFTEYHKNGQKKWVGQFKNGDNEVGELLEYDSTGQLIKKMFCDENSVCNTTWSINNQN